MINIITFTPVWQRPEIFKICLAGIKRLVNHDKKRFNIRPFFMVSESWAAAELIKLKYDFVYVTNDPLGAKKNAGIKYALENYQFDYIMEIGSDDLLTSGYLDLIEPLLLEGIQQLHPSSVYFADARNGEVAFWETNKVLGAGRCISRKAIETVTRRTTLWEPQGRRGMDTYSWRQLQNVGIGNHLINTRDVYALDIKSDVNINQMSAFLPSPLTLDEILIHFPEAELIRKSIAQCKDAKYCVSTQ